MRLLVATSNPGKVREIERILAGLPVKLVGLDRFPTVAPPAEDGLTFAENARAKALYYADACEMIAVAEDSGLEIDALDGEPGVHSARYGGMTGAYPRKFQMIFDRLKARNATTSPARFVCALAVAHDRHVLFEARGVVEGRITDRPRGDNGFGYDPIFFYPPFGKTLAEVSDEQKASVSHRGQAFRQLRTFLEKRR
ncbi:MAG: RdgB/HAM1 family non-canonical purine NTP pyrophosphatase [Bacteroidales bacterium]